MGFGGHPGVWPHTQLPPHRAQQGLKAMFPRCSAPLEAGQAPGSAFHCLPAPSPEHLRVGLKGISPFQLPAERAPKSMPLYFLESSSLLQPPERGPQSLPIQGASCELLEGREWHLPHTHTCELSLKSLTKTPGGMGRVWGEG